MMLFFHSLKNIIYTLLLNIFAPLQVRSCRCENSRKDLNQGEKRALSWASRALNGSMALEAALSLSLFLFFCLCLMMPMKMMDRQRQIQAAVETVGEELSQFAYISRCMEKSADGEAGKEDEENREVIDPERAGNSSSVLSAGYAAAAIMSRIDSSWVEAVSFAETRIGPDDMIHIVMNYRMRLPFSVFGLESLPFQNICSRRMWTGADGDRRKEGNGEDQGEEQEIVYIGKSSVRYHRQRTCHYLYNDLQQISAGNIGELRNREGKRYSPCRVCAAGKGTDTVYIMPYGTSYHSRTDCRAIIAWVQAVPLKQVEYLGACSYCGER